MDDAREVVLLVASWALMTGLSFAAVVVDERRMAPGRLERAWPPASRNAALVGFGILALPLHFARTRGDFRSARGVARALVGLVLGVAVTALVLGVSTLVTEALAYALGIPG